MNPFNQEFRGTWILGDRQYTVNFDIKGVNLNSYTYMAAWTVGPYDMSVNNTLTFQYAIDPTLKQFQTVAVNVAGATPAATQAWEVANALNANAVFSGLWTASYRSLSGTVGGTDNTVLIKSNRPNLQMKAYVVNSGAEIALTFNKKAPIGQLPAYFARHTVANILKFSDSMGVLVPLNAGDSYQASLITAAGMDPTTVLADWQLLYGRSGLFNFKTQQIDGSGRTTSTLDYPAGASVGDLAKQTKYTYSGAATTASQICEIPYVLTSGDLVTSP